MLMDIFQFFVFAAYVVHQEVRNRRMEERIIHLHMLTAKDWTERLQDKPTDCTHPNRLAPYCLCPDCGAEPEQLQTDE